MAFAQQMNETDARTRAAEVVEMPLAAELVACSTVEVESGGEDPLRHFAQRAGDLAGRAVSATKNAVSSSRNAASSTGNSATRVYHEARRRAVSGYHQLSDTSVRWMRATQASADVARNEYPLQTIGMIAGVAFLCGVGLRIWRNL